MALASVAERAGVSKITASRALQHGSPVAEATRQRVMTAVAELGYSPNLLARGLAQDRMAALGVAVLEHANPFFGLMLTGIQAIAAKRKFLVVVAESGRDEEEEQRYVRQFQQIRIGGTILSPFND